MHPPKPRPAIKDMRYGRVRFMKIKADFDALRRAIRAHDTDATEAAWDRCERWVDAIFQEATHLPRDPERDLK